MKTTFARSLRAGLLATSALAFALGAPAQAVVFLDEIGDDGAQTFAEGWNGVVQLYLLDNATGAIFFQCSGTLVNARTVMTAAHCYNDLPADFYGATGQFTPIIAYGEDTFDALDNWIATGEQFIDDLNGLTFGVDVLIHPQADLGAPDGGVAFPGADITMVALADPLHTIPSYAMLLSPVPAGAVEGGIHTVSVGYGSFGPASTGAIDINDKRRAGENMLGLMGSFNDFFAALAQDPNQRFPEDASSAQVLYWADMDLPGRTGTCARGTDSLFGLENSIECSDWDGFSGTFLDGDSLVLPGPSIDYFPGDALPNEATTAGGDSGGPLFFDQLTDQPLLAGVLSGGFFDGFFHAAGQEYGSLSYWNPLFAFHTWISANNPYVYASAAAGDGVWSDPTRWTRMLDPNYFVFDENGELVNGLPDTPDDGAFTEVAPDGVVFDSDPNDYPLTDGGIDSAPTPDDAAEDDAAPGDSALGDLAADDRADGEVPGVSDDRDDRLAGRVDDIDTLLDDLLPDDLADEDVPSDADDDGVIVSAVGDVGDTGFVPNNTFGDPGVFGDSTDDVAATFFDITLSADGVTTLDLDVEIDHLAITGETAGLDIPVDFTLTSLISVDQIDGLLSLDGELATREYMMLGGAIEGAGVLTAETVFNLAGLIAPTTGEDLSITGDYVQGALGALMIDIDADGHSALAVDGGVSLDGALIANFLAGSDPTFGDVYSDVLTWTGSDVGGFAATLDNLSGVLFVSADASRPGAIDLVIEAADFATVLPGDASENQLAMASLFDAARGADFDRFAEIFGVIDFLEGDALAAALDILSPKEALAAGATAQALGDVGSDEFIARMHLVRNSGVGAGSSSNVGARAQDPIERMFASTDETVGLDSLSALPRGLDWGVYARASYDTGDVETILDGVDDELTGSSLTLGLDKALTPEVIFGVQGKYQTYDSDFAGGLGSTDVSGTSGGAYLIMQRGDMFGEVYGSLGQLDLDTTRNATLGAASFVTTGAGEADQRILGGVIGKQRAITPGFKLTGTAGYEWVETEIDSIVETGSVNAFVIDGRTITSRMLDLGVRGDFKAGVGARSVVEPFVGLNVLYDLEGDDDAVLARLDGGAATPVILQGPDADRTWLEPSAGLSFRLAESTSLQLSYSQTVARDDIELRTVQLQLRSTW